MEEEENVNLPVSLFFPTLLLSLRAASIPCPPRSSLVPIHLTIHLLFLLPALFFAATLVGRWEEERGKIFAFAAVVSLGRKKLARLQKLFPGLTPLPPKLDFCEEDALFPAFRSKVKALVRELEETEEDRSRNETVR